MNQLAATALLQAALRRRIVSVKEALALRHVLSGCGSDPQVVRARLELRPEHVSEVTARALMDLLPPPDALDAEPFIRLAHLGDGRLGSTWLGLGQAGLVVLKRFALTRLDDASATKLAEEIAPLMGAGHRYLANYIALVRGPDGCWTLVQHYRQGRDASQRAVVSGEASEARALTLLRHVAKGLIQLHHAGLIHGDLHPGNILLDGEGRGALGDYALCGPAIARRWNATLLARQTWAAPEELSESSSGGPAADIYTLGCIGWWLLAGEPPFVGTAELQALQHQHADRPDVRTKAAGVSELTAKTLLKCMQVEVHERYLNARALVHSLERNLDELDRHQRDTESVSKAAGVKTKSLILEEPNGT